jgi:uncharacterized membrane protein YdfJ with MMPL/SSD domain
VSAPAPTRTGALMEHLAGFVELHRRSVLALWALLFVLSLPAFSKEQSHLTTGGFIVPGSQSQRVEAAARHFPALRPNALGVLVLAPAGRTLSATDLQAARAAITPAVAGVPGLALAPANQTTLAPARDAAVIALSGPASEDAAKDAANNLRPRLPGSAAGQRLYFVGQPAVWAGSDAVNKESLKSAEGVGLPLTALILIGVFGSLAAAALPLALGLISISLTGALVYGLGTLLPMSEFVSNITSLIGIAVGVDYSLFILVRYRAQIAAGSSPPLALRTAMRTSGRAVLFSGITVALALAGLFVVDSTVLRSMALGAIIAVAVAIAGALTLTPALVITLGARLHAPSRRIGALRERLARVAGRRVGPEGFWVAWGERVTRRPWLSLLAAVSVLVVLAIPAFSMRTVTEALGQLPAGTPERVGAEAAIARFGPVAGGETYVLESYRGGVDRALAARVRGIAATDREVLGVRELTGSDPDQLLLAVTTRDPAESDQARAFAARLERALAPLDGSGGASLSVGGTAAHEVQFDRHISGALWAVGAVVLLACALVILLLLRSIVLPAKAIAMNILTVGASFGVLVALFQYRWLQGVVNLEAPGYVATLALPFVLAIMFGLSMDYEVFLLARVQEEYHSSGDTRLAMQRALRSSAPTITSAALIMIVVFLTFVAVSSATIKMIGVGLAVAVALDATIVRLVLVPAAVVLMGRANWWMPAPLKDRLKRRQPVASSADQRALELGGLATALPVQGPEEER